MTPQSVFSVPAHFLNNPSCLNMVPKCPSCTLSLEFSATREMAIAVHYPTSLQQLLLPILVADRRISPMCTGPSPIASRCFAGSSLIFRSGNCSTSPLFNVSCMLTWTWIDSSNVAIFSLVYICTIISGPTPAVDGQRQPHFVSCASLQSNI